MRQYRIAAIPADGIGKEVIAAGLSVLAALEARDGGFRLEVEHFPWGSDYYRKHGRMMAEDGLERLKGCDAIFFGAVGDPNIPDTSRCGDCGCRSARASTSTPMCGRHACCRASRRRCATVRRATSTG